MDQPTTTAPPSNAPDVSNNWARYEDAKLRINQLVSVSEQRDKKCKINRDLRYTAVEQEQEKKENRLAPDELYVPQHIIDTNIRREQARYVSYITQSRRSIVLTDLNSQQTAPQELERDFTDRARYDGWQFPWFRLIDGMQQNGYGVMELMIDITKPGHLMLQDVGYGDFGYPDDANDIQACEMLVRRYLFTKTQLLSMGDPTTWAFDPAQIAKIITKDNTDSHNFQSQSLYPIEKVMFRIKGIVHVAWSCESKCDTWLRKPRPLFIGRMKLNPITKTWDKVTETNYPYYLFPYTISENTVIKYFRGRAYLDQDTQEAVSSLMSSYVTAHRRAAGFYFSRDGENDPNATAITQSNVHFVNGKMIDGKVRQFQLNAPGSDMLGAIQALVSSNMQENSQINYTANNRQDSRKTATEIQAAQTEAQLLSTIQLALFSAKAKDIMTDMFDIIRSRILAQVMVVTPVIYALYTGKYGVKPAGDNDVIERQEKLIRMQQGWPLIAGTPAASLYLQKMLYLMFPEDAKEYVGVLQQEGQTVQVLKGLATALGGLVSDPSQLSPDAQQHIPALQQLLQQATQIINPPVKGGQQQQAQPTQ